MRDFIEMNLFPECVHDFGKFNDVAIIFRQILFQEKKRE
jgi:hypothetical protein